MMMIVQLGVEERRDHWHGTLETDQLGQHLSYDHLYAVYEKRAPLGNVVPALDYSAGVYAITFNT